MRGGWRAALGIAVSAGFLVWALRGVEWTEVRHALAAANVPLLALSALVATLTFPLRARRWRTILAPVVENIPFGPLWRATAIGMMLNNVLPARAGEVARAYVLNREVPAVPFATAFASLAVDRVFDAVVLLSLLVVALFDPRFPATGASTLPVGNWAGLGTLLVAGLFACLYAIVFFPGRLIGWFELFARRVAPRIEARGRDALLAFASGLGVLRSPRRFAAVLAWTFIHWLVNALAFFMAFKAVGVAAPFTAALLLQGIIGIAVAIPAAPGFFGVFEYAGVKGLAIYGVSQSTAVVWAIGFHVFAFVPITVIGALYFARLGIRLGAVVPPASTGGQAETPSSA